MKISKVATRHKADTDIAFAKGRAGMQIQIEQHVIPNVDALRQLGAIERAGKACDLKLQMMIAVGAMKTVYVLEDNGQRKAQLDTFDKVNSWIRDNVATDIEQYQYVETTVLPRWGAS
jgi:hypothetical protein